MNIWGESIDGKRYICYGSPDKRGLRTTSMQRCINVVFVVKIRNTFYFYEVKVAILTTKMY